MNVVLYSATGMIGSRILNELISRGHCITAVVRDPSKVPAHPAANGCSSAFIARRAFTASSCVSNQRVR